MNNLKNARKAKGLTQIDVAKYIGLSQSAYSDWERGVSNIDSASLMRLADLLDVSVDYILGKTETRKAETPLVNNDPELTAYLEELRTRPEKRMLMDVTKNATKAEVEAIADFISKLRERGDD
jgi:transcriptional regulator with XRE-family HTH domain